MKCILDTHFLLWVATSDIRLDEFAWLEQYMPWGVSPVSFLEVKFLHDIGKLEVDIDAFASAVGADARFTVDELPLLNLVTHAFPLAWTRDPFDRLLAAHSNARRTPLCTLDRQIRKHYPRIVQELALS